MGYTARTHRTEWRDLSTSAARWAAPWWLLTWLLTGGRFGKPLFRRVEIERKRPDPPPGWPDRVVRPPRTGNYGTRRSVLDEPAAPSVTEFR